MVGWTMVEKYEKYKISGLAISLLLLAVSLQAFSPENYFIRNYSQKDGLSMDSCQVLVKDRDGYIWTGTQEGLNRFDGANFKIYSKENDGLPNNYINYLFIDSQKRLWTATRGGVALYDKEKDKFTAITSRDDVPFENNASCMDESQREGILVGTSAGLFTIKDNKMEKFPLDHPLIKGKILDIAVDGNDTLYLGTPGNGLIVIDRSRSCSQVRQVTEKDGLVSNKISCLLIDDTAGLWVGTDAGLTLYDKGKFIKTYTTENAPLSNNGINDIFKDSRGSTWIATQDGLNQMKDGSFFYYRSFEGLASNRILSIGEDLEQGIWVGMSGGLGHMVVNKFKIFSRDNGMPSNNCYGFFQAHDGQFWVATHGGIVVIDEKKKEFINYTKKNGLSSNTIRTITGDRDKNIWIATYGGGLIRFKAGKFKSYTKTQGLPGNDVEEVYADREDRLWLGMKDGGLILFDKEKEKVLKHYTENSEPKLLNNNVWFIKEDSKGYLWIGVDGGLSKFNFKDEKFTHFSKKEDLICKDTHDILKDGEGYWIAAYGDGIYYLEENKPAGKKFTKYTKDDGLPDNCIYRIIPDQEGWLWLATNHGVCRWDKKKDFSYYTVDNGFPSNENNTHGGYVDSQGRIWFSTHRGLALIDPREKTLLNSVVPPVLIQQLKIDNKEAALWERPLIFKHDQNNIYIKFTGLSYRFPGAVKFKTRLMGFPGKGQWEELKGKDRFVEYTNLPPGEYAFQVKACNDDGLWNENGARLEFTIKPSFFQTPWFYFLMVLAVFFSSYGFYKIINVQKQKKIIREKLEQLVKERTRELEETQAHLIHQGKMASLGEMAAELAHEMNNPANYIYGNIDLLEKYLKDIKSILWEYLKLELPVEHPVNRIRKDLYIEEEVTELDGLIKYVKEGAVRISDIVNNLMDFVGKDEPGVQAINIHENIEITINLLQNKIKNRVEIEKIFGEIPKIEGYLGPMNQVWMNLLSNAAGAIPGQGVITIETSMKDANHVVIRISDTGVGIPEKNLGRIFEPFFTTKLNKDGMGLGLPITKKIIERHNGKINFESKVGQGTSFSVILPIKQINNKIYNGDKGGNKK
jgi:signal transduction histidine kinase/ligand-binding sensor domain-containing protein